jgi:hypothetical protein
MTDAPVASAPDNPSRSHGTWIALWPGGVHLWRYALTVTPWLTVQPDIQYIVHPGSQSSVNNAFVVERQLSFQF